MKHLCRLLALLMLLTTLLGAAGAEEPLAAWPWDTTAPHQLVHAGDWWYAATGRYGLPNASLAIGEAPDALTQVYASQGYVWGVLRATQTHAAWVEEQDGVLRWMLHTRESGETITVYTEPLTDERPCFFVGLDEADYYYVRIGAGNRNELVRRSLGSGEETVLPTPEDAVISSLSLVDGELAIACETGEGWFLIRMDSVTGEEIARDELPPDVVLVFYAEYSPRYRAYAFYCATEQEEGIGFCQQGRSSLVLGFSGSAWAYHDHVILSGGRLLCISKVERTGDVADNFMALEVNLIEKTVKEYPGAIGFLEDEGRLLLLTIDPENDRVVLEAAE